MFDRLWYDGLTGLLDQENLRNLTGEYLKYPKMICSLQKLFETEDWTPTGVELGASLYPIYG